MPRWNVPETVLRLCSQSVVSDSETPQTVARQAPLSMGFSRKEYGSGLPSPPPGDLPDPGIDTAPPVSASGFLPLSSQGSPRLWSAPPEKGGGRVSVTTVPGPRARAQDWRNGPFLRPG